MVATTRNSSFVPILMALAVGASGGWFAHSLRPLDLSQTKLLKMLHDRQTIEKKSTASRSEELLNANAKRKGVFTLSNGLQYEFESLGSGNKIQLTDKIQLRLHQQILQDSTPPKPAITQMTDSELEVSKTILGLQAGLQLMRPGAVFRFFVPPDLAYGNEARPGIPPGSVLVYDVSLKSSGR